MPNVQLDPSLSLVRLWWLIAYPLLSVPFLRFHGAAYAAIIVISLPLIWNTRFKLAVAVLLFLHLYQLLVTMWWTGNLTDVRDLNSPLMIQTSVALLTMGLYAHYGLSQWLMLPFAVSLVAFLSVLAEVLGIDVQSVLPSKYHEFDSYTPGVITYQGVAVRLRGVYAEASALGGVCGGFASITLLAFVMCTLPRWVFVISICMLLMCLSLLAITLTKAGLFMLGTGLLVGLVAMLLTNRKLYAARALILSLVLSAIVLTVVSTASSNLQEYLLKELDSVAALVGGGPEQSVAGRGMFGRSEGIEIGVAALMLYPFGSYQANVVNVATQGSIPLSDELTYYFTHGVYGLKSYWSNLAVTAGWLGIAGLLAFVVCLPRIFSTLGDHRIDNDSVLRPVAMVMALAFGGFVEDRYFVFAYAVMLVGLASFYSALSSRAPSDGRIADTAYSTAD
jgi:hypothetical protein